MNLKIRYLGQSDLFARAKNFFFDLDPNLSMKGLKSSYDQSLYDQLKPYACCDNVILLFYVRQIGPY